MKKLLLFGTTLFSFMQFVFAQNTSPFWSTAGNSNATATSKLGTTNAINLRILTNNVERIRVSSSGNVGIGTTLPAYKLHVAGDAYISNELRVYGNGIIGSGSTYGIHGVSTGTSGQGVLGDGGLIGVLGRSSLSGGNGIRGEVTAGNAYGVAGIGGLIGVFGRSTLNGANGVRGEVTAADAYGVAGIGGLIGVYGKSSLNDGANGVRGEATGTNSTGVRGVGMGAGCVGIFGYSKYSHGIMGYTEAGRPSYAGYFVGEVYANGFFAPSDRGLKQDIADMPSAIDLIKKLQPKSYTFRQDGHYKLMNLPAGTHYGLIAQDVEQAFPALVRATIFENRKAEIEKASGAATEQSPAAHASGNIEFKALNYMELIPIMIKAIQEQQSKIEEQCSKIHELHAKIEALTQVVNKELPNNNTSGKLSNASLDQNFPNPFTNSTSISYTLPEKVTRAQILITDKNGKTLQVISLSGSGKSILRLDASTLAPGSYNYSLMIDGKMIGSKQMIAVK